MPMADISAENREAAKAGLETLFIEAAKASAQCVPVLLKIATDPNAKHAEQIRAAERLVSILMRTLEQLEVQSRMDKVEDRVQKAFEAAGDYTGLSKSGGY